MADLSVTAANVLKGTSAVTADGTAGAAITAGQVVYIDTTTTPNTIKLADANGTTPANSVAGIALNGGAIGQPIKYVTQDLAFALGATVVSGDMILLSATPGGLTKTPADLAGISATAIFIGIAIDSSHINLRPAVGGPVA